VPDVVALVLPADQSSSTATSDIKKRHLGGADFHTLSYGPKDVDPKKKPSYADLAEYCPLEERRQM